MFIFVITGLIVILHSKWVSNWNALNTHIAGYPGIMFNIVVVLSPYEKVSLNIISLYNKFL